MSKQLSIIASINDETEFRLQSLEQAEALMSIISQAEVIKKHVRPAGAVPAEERIVEYATGKIPQLKIEVRSTPITSTNAIDEIIEYDAHLAENDKRRRSQQHEHTRTPCRRPDPAGTNHQHHRSGVV